MGSLGFVFESIEDQKDFIVFTYFKRLNYSLVVGFTQTKPKLDKIYFLSDDLTMNIDNSKEDFLYNKICVSKDTMYNLHDFTLWFSSKKYREIRKLLTINSFDEIEVIKRVSELLEYFK